MLWLVTIHPNQLSSSPAVQLSQLVAYIPATSTLLLISQPPIPRSILCRPRRAGIGLIALGAAQPRPVPSVTPRLEEVAPHHLFRVLRYRPWTVGKDSGLAGQKEGEVSQPGEGERRVARGEGPPAVVELVVACFGADGYVYQLVEGGVGEGAHRARRSGRGRPTAFLMMSVRREVRMREMARPRRVTWCLWEEAEERRLERQMRMRGRKRAYMKSWAAGGREGQ
ncbi:hypothetical protein QC764_0070980 [Podospora pseudoanserina]|uniref:Uncharacterized protein n=1 Tax=Podospora pseudoanserina TaxID=2609844 RepID=A0ABR0IC88_9PEZI|nr:hypothetical protein QC764_0070980 [Podospora pseudoanserina]